MVWRAALLAVLVLASASCQRARPPNVLLIVIDTLRADRLGAYGNPRGLTPFMDELAQRGTVFLNAYSTTSWTCPAVASLLTSRYPSQHHVVGFASVLAGDEVTLTEKIEPLRYVAGGFSANFRLLDALGYAQGFQHWQADFRKGEDLRGDELRRQSLGWLDAAWRAAAGPALIYLHYMEPHAPYDPPEPYRAKFQRRENGGADAAAVNDKLLSLRWHELDRDDVQLLESLYDGEVAAVDAELQLLFGELERRGFLQDAIVVVTSDHGEEFWDHGNLTHGITLYNESVRVPLILVAPGYSGGRRIEENVSLVDVAPTLLELLRLPPEPRFEGRSLVPFLKGQSTGSGSERVSASAAGRASGDVILQLEATGEGLDAREHAAGIIRKSSKLLVRPNGFSETYDLAADPREMDAKSQGPDDRPTALAKTLEEVRADLLKRAGAAANVQPVDEATREKLRALGYRF